MNERPIIFSAPMVLALLAGRKTQTRRIAKLTAAGHVKEPRGHRRWHPGDPEAVTACPYGQPGDRLWVRESFNDDFEDIQYKADGEMDGDHHDAGCKWRPSIHMPRVASRIALEITEIRLQRLQDITANDAIAEGLKKLSKDGGQVWKYGIPDRDGLPGTDNVGWPWAAWAQNPVQAFVQLWGGINGHDSWKMNPWVWAVSFQRVK